jgi:hypothetical protein
MVASDLTDAPSQQRWWPLAFMAGGALFVGLSFVRLAADGGRSDWTDEKAIQYQEAAAMFHVLAHESGHTPENGPGGTERGEKLREAQLRFDELRHELESARSRLINWAIVLRTIGVVLAIVGAIAYFANLLRRPAELRDYHKVMK